MCFIIVFSTTAFISSQLITHYQGFYGEIKIKLTSSLFSYPILEIHVEMTQSQDQWNIMRYQRFHPMLKISANDCTLKEVQDKGVLVYCTQIGFYNLWSANDSIIQRFKEYFWQFWVFLWIVIAIINNSRGPLPTVWDATIELVSKVHRHSYLIIVLILLVDSNIDNQCSTCLKAPLMII